MQLYLDGFKNNFYTFFFVNDKTQKNKNKELLTPFKFLRQKKISEIISAQKMLQRKFLKIKTFHLEV